jgi:Grx4 family monothiol glutaredoxin
MAAICAFDPQFKIQRMIETMELSDAVKGKIESYLDDSKVVLFMKGTRQQPMCGFSARTVAALDSILPDYATVNVLDDEDVREGIKAYGNWPTIPQLYIDGELVGGCDIVLNMLNTGELHEHLGLGRTRFARRCRATKASLCISWWTPTGTRSSTWPRPRAPKSPANRTASRC